MAGFVAKKLCPELIQLPLNFDKYTAKATEVREILADYDPRFESASIDEAYLNITEYCAEHDMKPFDVVQQLRREVHEKTKITVSAGIAANAKLAKICSNMNKPNGQYLLPSDRQAIMAFMRDLPCRKVNGIGRVLERELLEIGVKNCGDLYAQREFLAQLFGEKTYDFLIRCYLGLGRTTIQPAEEYERKSVGTESTFRDMSDPTQLRDKLRRTADELEKDMRRAQCKGRTLVLKVKLHTYEVFTRQVVLPKAVCLADDLYNYSLPILAKLEQEIPGMKLRLMGLRCTHLVSTKKPDTRVFFGLRPLNSNPTAPPGTDQNGDGEWEQWPDEMVEHEIPADTATEAERRSTSPYRHHGKEIEANPGRNKDTPPEELWDCPICGRPQAADERQFNLHIDLCLSRQTIRDAVQDDAMHSQPVERGVTPENRRPKTSSEKKRGRPSAGPDPRQKKLCFG